MAVSIEPGIRALAKRPGFLPLLVAEVISGLGSMMTALALPWFVLQTTGSVTRTSVVLAAEVLAVVLLGVPSSALAARLGARRTLLLAQLLAAPLIALIPVLHYSDLLPFPVLLFVVFLVGSLWTPWFAAQAAIVPELVGEDQRTVGQANALLQGASRATYWLGPLTAGLLIAVVDAPVVLLIDAATFLAGFALLTLVPDSPASVATERGTDILAGVRYIVRTPLLRSIVATQVLGQASFQALLLALPVLAFEGYGQDSRVAGTLEGAWGAGALFGSLIAVPLVRRRDPLSLGAIAWVAQALPLWVLVFQAPLVLLVVALFASGGANGIRYPPTAALTILRVPAPLRPQSTAAASAAAMFGGLITLGLTGPALEMLGRPATFAAIAGISSLGATLFVTAGRRERRRMPTAEGARTDPQ
jgi:MFS family permease